MLKDNDLNEIGKRLYELEADPPKDGWNKIAGIIPKPTGRGAYIKRHWWKGLFILVIPAAVYLAMPLDSPAHNESALLKKEPQKETVAPLASLKDEDDSSKSMANESSSGESQMEETEHSSKGSSDTDADHRQDEGTNIERQGGNEILTASTPVDSSKERIEDSQNVLSENYAGVSALKTVSRKTGKESAGTIPAQTETREEDNTTSLIPDTLSNSLQGNNDIPDANPFAQKSENSSGKITLQNDTTVLSQIINETATYELIPVDESILQDGNSDSVSNSRNDPTVNAQILRDDAANMGTFGPGRMHQVDGDSLLMLESVLKNNDTTTAVAATQKDAEEKSTGHWRITAGFSPSFMYKSVQPRPGDEVLVTGIERKKSSIPQRIGYGISVGVGKEVRSNMFIDAQLAFQTNTEQFSYSYTTGAVDTLIARKEQDGSVSITPVYTITSAQIKSRLNHGGVRIGATYYFWNKPRRRFNISAIGGTNFLLSSDVKMNVNGNWVAIENDEMNKVNFSLMLSAGYSYRFTRGWELMINPNITYFTEKGNGYQQLSNTNQRSQGINIMISKFF